MTPADRNQPRGHQAGVTLLEVIAVIAIIGVIFSLALPAIGSARERGGALRSLANLRQIGGAFEGYIKDYGTFPFGQEGHPYPASYLEDAGETFPHFAFDTAWAVLLRHHAPWDEYWEAMFSPGKTVPKLRAGTGYPASYFYANSFLDRPELWSGRARGDLESLLRPVKPADVVYPSQKVLMWDGVVAYLRSPRPLDDWSGFVADPTPMLFVDGHARERRAAEATAPVINPLRKHHVRGWIKLSNTRDGSAGRDYEE